MSEAALHITLTSWEDAPVALIRFHGRKPPFAGIGPNGWLPPFEPIEPHGRMSTLRTQRTSWVEADPSHPSNSISGGRPSHHRTPREYAALQSDQQEYASLGPHRTPWVNAAFHTHRTICIKPPFTSTGFLSNTAFHITRTSWEDAALCTNQTSWEAAARRKRRI